MTVSLTYDDTTARVLIDVDDFGDDVAQVMLERSTDQMHWTTVRGAVALDLSGGAVTGHADYEFASCVENFYRASAIPMGLYLPGVTGSYASTPDNAQIDVVGDLDFRALVTLPALVSGQNYMIGVKWSSPSQRSFLFWIRDEGGGSHKFRINWTADGSTALSIPASVNITGERKIALRATLDVDNGAGGRTGRFYTADTLDGPWVAHGTDVVQAGTTSVFSSNAPLIVGVAETAADASEFIVHAFEFRNGIDGTLVVDANFDEQDHHDTSFVDDTGLTWTVNGTASIETTQTSTSITPTLTQVWIKSVTRPFLNRPVGGSCTAMGELETELLVSNDGVTRPTRSAAFPIINRTYPVGVTDLALGRLWTLRTRTWTLEAHRLMDYLYASGDVIFIQVPCSDCAQTVENGYVIAFDPTYQRHRRYRNRVVWEATVQEVAPPGPDVAYREATWATVLAQYGSWSAVIAANPTWAHVLALLPDPSEVIVA